MSQINLVSCSLNINGLTLTKLTVILYFMRRHSISVMHLIDTHIPPNIASLVGIECRNFFGAGTVVKASILQDHPDPIDKRYHPRVGGLVTIITPGWAQHIATSWADPTGLGLVMGVIFMTPNRERLQHISTYWPPPPSSTNARLDTLHKRAQSWIDRNGLHTSVLTYIQQVIERHTFNFSAKYPTSSTCLHGDFNSAFNGNSTYPNPQIWANDLQFTPTITDPTVSTYYSGLRPTSHIDHIFFRDQRNLYQVTSIVHDDPIWHGVTDHRPVIAMFRVDGGCPNLKPTAEVFYPKDVPTDNPAKLQDYKDSLSATLARLPAKIPTDPDQILEELRYLSLTMPETVEHILGAPKIPKRHYRHGWSPGYMLLKTHLSTLVTIRRHLLGTHRCNPWSPSERERCVRKLIA